MGEYFKMADVLGDVVAQKIIGDAHEIMSHIYGHVCVVNTKERADIIANAINSHDELVAEVERLRGSLLQCVEALYIAHKFCGNHTADECGDEIAIPISDALVAASKLVAP